MKEKSKSQLAKKKGVDRALLDESLKLSKQLQKAGVSTRKHYDLRSPFEKRLVKASASELLESAQ